MLIVSGVGERGPLNCKQSGRLVVLIGFSGGSWKHDVTDIKGKRTGAQRECESWVRDLISS